MRTPGELTAVFRSRGLRVTPQRECIFRILAESQQHPTVEDVYSERESEQFRAHIIAIKRRRRFALGDIISIVFENTDTMRF